MSLRLLPYDTETTGIPNWKTPSDGPDQPHLVQLAALLIDGTTRKVRSSMDVIIKPDGWLIPVEASNIHGITTEKAMELGIPERDALAMFMDMWNIQGEQCNRIAFNEMFDARILRIAQLRHPEVVPAELAADWKAGRAECAMRMARPLCGLPKAPSLHEAYRHFTGLVLPEAHTALGDTLGCATVYFACVDKKAAGTATPFTLPAPEAEAAVQPVPEAAGADEPLAA